MIDVNGSVKHLYTYGPFGKKLESDSDPDDLPNPFRFTGQYFDTETGDYHLRARTYSPALQRFTSRDPYLGQLEEPATLHAYLYCFNDPINATDPTGEMTKEETITTTSIGTTLTTMGGPNAQTFLQRAKDFANVISQRNWVYGQTITKMGNSINKWTKSMNAIGKEVHHMVCKGRGNTATYGKEMINNFNNLIAMDPQSHQKMTTLYNSGKRLNEFMARDPDTYGRFRTLQHYISSLDFNTQARWAQAAIIHLGKNGTLQNFDPTKYGLQP